MLMVALRSCHLTRRRLGEIIGARSGDKGGNANVGIWARQPEDYHKLRHWLTADRLRGLLPRPFDGPIDRYELANLCALNFVLRGYLGDGAFANVYLDNQAKLLAEQIRNAVVDWPD